MAKTIYSRTSLPFSVEITQEDGVYRTRIGFRNEQNPVPVVLISKETETQRQAKRFMLDSVSALRRAIEGLETGIRKDHARERQREGFER